MDPISCNDPTHADLLTKFEQMAAQILALMQQVQALTQREAVREKAPAAEPAALRREIADSLAPPRRAADGQAQKSERVKHVPLARR